MKTIVLNTNYNNKLSCNAFIHIAKSPDKTIPECDLNAVYEIRTADKSHKPVKAALTSITRIKLGQMVDCCSMPSHALDAYDFIEWWKSENPDDSYGIELAVYYYKIVI